MNEELEGRGIWTIDRGGDRRKIIAGLSEIGAQFVIRAGMRRNIKDMNEEEKNIL